MRYRPGSLGPRWVAHLEALIVATVLWVPYLILPATPAAAACRTSERIDHWRADFLPAGAFFSQVTLVGLRIDGWRGREADERAGRAGLPGVRWGEWSPDRFAQSADDGITWTGSREMSGRDLVLVGSFPVTLGDSAAPGVHSLVLDWGPAAPMRLAVEHGNRDDAVNDAFGADCERGRLLAPTGPSYGVGDGGSSGAALGFRAHRPRDLGRASLAHRRAWPGNRIDWNGRGPVALSGPCFESEGRGPC